MNILGSILGLLLFGLGLTIAIIAIICNYLANKISEKIEYDYLAQRIAEEICKRMMIIENQRKAAYKGATPAAEDQAGDETDPGQGGCSR